MAHIDFVEKYKDALARIQENLTETNMKGCFNNSVDLTRMSEFVGFDEGLFIGEVFEGIFDNLRFMTQAYEYKKEEIAPIKTELNNLINLVKGKIPSKNEKIKVEIYDALIRARSCVTNLQVEFMRERQTKGPRPMSLEAEFETT